MLCALLPAPYKKHGSRGHRIGTHVLSGVLSEWQPADMQSKKSNQTKNHLKVINDDHPLPDCLRKYTALPYHAPENCGGSFPMKDIQHSHSTKSSDVPGM